MKRKMLRNGLAAGIIFLFMGINVASGINGNIRTIVDISRDIGVISEIYYDGPAEEWNKTFGESYKDWFGSGIKTSDGNYIVRGSLGLSDEYHDRDWWLLNIDSYGNEIWSKTFGGSGSEYFNGLVQASNGGYILVGSTTSYGHGSEDIWVLKTDTNGHIEWNKTFGGSDAESVHNVETTNDGGYLIVGWTISFGDENGDLWLIKIDNNGGEEWNRTYGGIGTDGADHAIQLEDGGYMIVGITTSYGAGGFDVWLIKTDNNGNEEWSDTFGGTYDDFINDVEKTADGGFILVGITQQSESDDDIWLLKFDEEWNLEWEKSIGDNDNNEHGNAILTTLDSSHIVVGDHRSRFITGNQQGMIMKVDPNGYVEWSKLFGGPEEEIGRDVLLSPDGGYIIFGLTGSYGAGDWDGWVVKFSADDNQRPNKPSRPSGPSSGNINEEYTYATSTIDADGDQIYYMWDWGDGSYSQWLGPYDSGEECSASYMWTSRGSYEIKVKAKDTNGAESEWSDPLPISMPKTYENPLWSLIEKIFDWLEQMFGRVILTL